MDGLIILALIAWFFVKKKKPKAQKTAVKKPEKKETVLQSAQTRAERLTQLHDQLEERKRNLQMQTVKEKTEPSVIKEGDSQFQNISYEQSESLEGECICDPELEHARETETEQISVYSGEIGREPVVDFSARGILQGVVMSEILTRPSQRTFRR